MPDVKKKPRKISCLPCRNKKARCDELRPHCSRCIRNNREHLCIYPKPKTFGRPPKNAALNKSKEIETAAIVYNEKNNVNYPAYRESNYESYNVNQSTNSSPSSTVVSREAMHVPQRFIKHKNHQLNIERIFSIYITRGITLRQKFPNYEFVPHFKLRTLNYFFTFLTTCMVNCDIKRACQFTNIYSFTDPEITLKAFMKDDQVYTFFYKAESQFANVSPIESVPAYHAIQLINYFFDHYPYHILLNKTILLQKYWCGLVEPFLLCVIYGIATYVYQQNVNPNSTWEPQRNVFLDHAYVLMERYFLKEKTSRVDTLGKYQAAVLLGTFEIIFGLSKHGMTIVSVTYKMAAELGVFNHNFEVTDGVIDSDLIDNSGGPSLIDTLDPVGRELLINTYWGALRATAYGCAELGLFLQDPILFHGQPFPAANGSTSASFQLDSAHNNHSESSACLIESFHTDMVITYFSTKLFACLPATYYNFFGGRVYQKPVILERLSKTESSSEFQNSVPINDPKVQIKVQRILNDFSNFISEQKPQWSFQQSYTIETTYHLYYIHFSFLKPKNNVNPLRFQDIVADLDLTNPRIAAWVANLQPTALILIDLLERYFQEIEDRKLFNPLEEFTMDSSKVTYTALLPYILISTALETMVELTMYHYRLGINPLKTYEQIRSVHCLIKNPILWISQQQSITEMIDKKFHDFITINQIPLTENDSSFYNLMSPNITNINTMGTSAELIIPPINVNISTPSIFIDNSIDPITASTASMNLNPSINGYDPTLMQDIDKILTSLDDLY